MADAIVLDEPILSPPITYRGDQRNGFQQADGTPRLMGIPRLGEPWDGRLWQAYEAEVQLDEQDRPVKTRVRFLLVSINGQAVRYGA